jgi:uncharacterized membrane protein
MECLSAFALVAGLAGIVGVAVALSALKEARSVRAELAAMRAEIWSLAGQLQQIQVGKGRLGREEAPEAVAEVGPAPAAGAPALSPAVAASPAATDLPVAAPSPPRPPDLGGGAATPGAPRAATPPQPSVRPTQPAFSSLEDAAGGAAAPPARPSASLEERLGARAPVWVGSIALALAGAFLVKYSVDQGWIGPAVRLALAILFGVALLGAGEALRTRVERIAAGLSAAGIAVLFAAWLAGVNLYHLITPALGFTFLALTAALAVLLALRQGPIVALVGLVGGFLTPSLISTAEPDARVLFGYLLLLQAGLLTASRRQRWRWLPELALAGGLLWVVAWLAGAFGAADALWLALFLVGMVAVVLLIERLTGGAPAGSDVEEQPEASWLQPALAVAGAVMAMGLVTARAGYTPREWAFQALLVAAALVLARVREELHGLAWLAVGVAFALLAVWSWDLAAVQEPRFLWTALAIGGLCAAGGYAAHFGAARPARWTALAALAGLAFFVLAWGSATELRPALPWGALALAAAVVYLAAAVPVARRRARTTADGEPAEADALGPALAALAVAVTAFVSLAVPLELERQWWTVAWALEVPALVWLGGHFRLPALRQLAGALALGVAVRLLANPDVLGYPIGTRPVVNWLLYGYGLSLLAIAGAAALARRDRTFGPGRLAPGLEAIGVALVFALVSLEVRQGFHPGRLGTGVPSLVEWGTYTVAWLLLGLALLAAGRRLSLERAEQGGALIMMAGFLGAVAGSGFLGNPLWQHEAVGATPVFNFLLWIYGVPALLAALAGRLLRRRGEDRLAAFCGVGALVLLFLLVTLEVTQAFHGTYLDDEPATAAEKYAYSAAWLLFGTGLLVAGIARRGRFLRYASLAVMSLTVGKVFLFDTAHLTDLYRVLSFLGLGLSLLLLAFLYQRFVFRAPAD